jgi:DNA invertase Pin-like site-specific DNA recombinase
MAIAVYVRVSSTSQDFRSQEPDLKRWVAVHAEGQEVHWYRDKSTGHNMARPGWGKLEKDLREGKISKIVVWRLDRLGRTTSGLTKLFDELLERRVGLISTRDSLDLQTTSGRLMCRILASVSEYESEVRRERQHAGIQAAKANGKRWGGSKKGRRLKVTPEQERTIKHMASAGETKSSMARATGLSRPTIYAILEKVMV